MDMERDAEEDLGSEDADGYDEVNRLPASGAVVEGLGREQAEADEAVGDADENRLAHQFYDAYKAADEVSKGKDAAREQGSLDALINKLKAIAYRVVQLRLFSPNEELEDISTADLKYLLVPFLLAEATAATKDLTLRLRALQQALVYWRAFANDCHRLKVAHEDDCGAIDRSPENALDPNSQRDEKIARYKRSKELSQKANYLFEKKREALGDEYMWGAGGCFDEDMERELIMALLARAVATAADNIASAEKEIPLLEMMLSRGGPGAAPPPKAAPAEKPFIVRIQDKAELMRLYKEMVFQCPYELPSITLAECADIEMAQARERQDRKDEAERLQQAEEDDRWWRGDRQGAKEDEEDERKTYKDRDWDDWKDEHPYGCGNKMANLG